MFGRTRPAVGLAWGPGLSEVLGGSNAGVTAACLWGASGRNASSVRVIARGLPGHGNRGSGSAPLGCHVESHEKGHNGGPSSQKKKILRCVSPKPQRARVLLASVLAKLCGSSASCSSDVCVVQLSLMW